MALRPIIVIISTFTDIEKRKREMAGWNRFLAVIDVIKLFFGGNLDFPKIKKLKATNICFDVRTWTEM